MKKNENFQLIWKYLKDEKLRLFLYIILVVVTYAPALLAAFFWGKALEALIIKQFTEFILYLVLWEGIYILCFSFLQIPRDKLYNYLEIKFTKNISKDLYLKLDKLPAKAFEEIGTGEFMNRIYTDPDRVMELLNKIIRMICKAIVVLFVIIIAFQVSWIVGLEIVIFGIVMGVISFKFFPKIKKTQEEIKKESDQYMKKANENISGIREIKSLGIKNNIEKILFNTIDCLFKHTKKVKNYEIVYYSLNNLTYFILQFVILFSCGYFFVQGEISYATFIMIELYIWRVDEVVESISDLGVSYNKIVVSLKRMSEILDNKLFDDEKFGTKELSNIQGKIEFKNVKFKYSEKENYTLNNLSLNIIPNKKNAIVGKSGNGKSTIFNLLLRYFDSNKGKILIDDINITDLTENSLRSCISVIRQNPFIFNATILENFKLVKENISLEEVRKVCKEAYIDDYIMSLPNKYDTVIGEGGINLSGGQKQRLAIARTLILNTKIILFDEATSALDNESQEFIKKTIDNLAHDHTIIIVAHRLSTIIDADVINIINEGVLVASGKHDYLFNECDIYRSLYMSESSNS